MTGDHAAMVVSRVIPIVAVWLVLAVPAAAQTVEEIVQRHVEARGGARLKDVNAIRLVRTYGTFGANIPVTITKKRPGLYRSDQALPGRPEIARGLDPAGAWESIGGKVTRRPADQETELRETEADFDGFLVDYKAKGHSVTHEGRQRIGGIDTHKLKVTLRSGAVRHVYLDAATYLDRRHEGTIIVGDARVPLILTFGDWRDVGGVKFPFAIDEERVSYPPQTFAIYTERIEINPAVDDAIFAMPK